MADRDIASLLFELENYPQLMEFSTRDGIPIWMMARYYLLYIVVSGRLMGYKSESRHRRTSKRMVSCLLKTWRHNAGKRGMLSGKEIILYTTNRKTQIDGQFFNRYVDKLYELAPERSAVIEQALLDWGWPFPRKNNEVLFDTLSRVAGEIRARLFWKRESEAVRRLVARFSQRTRQIAGIQLEDRECEEAVVYISRLIVAMRYQAQWLGRKIGKNTKMVLTVGAGFPYYYPINVMLKRRGILSVELQHGYITSNNVMYNYADALVGDPRVQEGLADYIMTYGTWWNGQFNAPMRAYTLGNPYRDYSLAKIRPADRDNANVMVIGIGENTGKYMALTRQITAMCPERRVVFRPHPGELQMALELKEKVYSDVAINETPDIYSVLSDMGAIISEVSTVLFEAIGIVNRIIVWRTDYSKAFLPAHPFEQFESLDELGGMLKSRIPKTYQIDDVWNSQWRENYTSFIENI